MHCTDLGQIAHTMMRYADKWQACLAGYHVTLHLWSTTLLIFMKEKKHKKDACLLSTTRVYLDVLRNRLVVLYSTPIPIFPLLNSMLALFRPTEYLLIFILFCLSMLRGRQTALLFPSFLALRNGGRQTRWLNGA